jgi:UDP-3-O-[3-hydroxymyristoyl] glucosamine N-acyltransferase
MNAGDLAAQLGAELIGDKDLPITSIRPIQEPASGTLSFLASPRYEEHLYDSVNRVILVPADFTVKRETGATLIFVADVYESWALSLALLQSPPTVDWGVHPSAIVSETAVCHDRVSVGPYSVIEADVQIGEGTVIMDQVKIGRDVRIGEECMIHPGVKIYNGCILGNRVVIHANAVIGSDGFGFAMTPKGYVKIPQVGHVEIEDDVEVGANACIDRAGVGRTRIGKGSKIDNLVQIGHGALIDEHVAIAAQAGISGSAQIGKGSQLGGQSGVAGHITIAPGSRIQAQSGIAGNIDRPGLKWYGSPVLSYFGFLRSYNLFKKLPELLKRLENVERIIRRSSEDID